MPERTLILLDVDGVLVQPVGYKTALHTLVNHFAARMGQPPYGPTDDEIAVFEACGLTNEWDSGAVCVSVLLLAALEACPEVRRDTLDETFAAIKAAGVAIPRPDFTAVARAIARENIDGRYPAAHFLELLAGRTDATHLALVRELLGDVYAVIHTPTTHAFQTLVLGSERFARAYRHPAAFESESYLTTRDIALLDAATRERLLAWAAMPQHGAAIYTARPSGPPADLPHEAPIGDPPAGYPPEAELAAELVGLAQKMPLIGQGRVGWLAWRNGRAAAEYIKPSPVQALTAIGAALSGSETDSLLAAAALYEQGTVTGPLARLRDGATRVVVFEDAAGGIRAVRDAVDYLVRAGLDVTVTGVGVSPHADKQAALAPVADHVIDEVNAGLALILDGWQPPGM